MRRALGRLIVALGLCAVAVGRKLADDSAERLRRSIEEQCRENRRQALARFGNDGIEQ